MKKVTALATKSAPSLATADQTFPEELVSAVDRMLARNPEDRFESAKEVSDALSPLADGTRLNAFLTDALHVQTAPMKSEFGTGLQMLQPYGTQSTPRIATKTAPKSNRNGPLRIAAITLGILGLFLAGLLYRITTDKGDLIIESDIADVQLEIKRSDRVVKESYEVHTGQQSLRLFSGDYEIKILQPFSGISLSKNQVTLTRDDKKTIKITRAPTAKQNQLANLRDSSLDLTPDLQPRIGSDRVYDNRTFEQWYQKGTRETNPASLTGIGQALVTVADSKDEYQKAIKLMIEIQQRGADDTGFLFVQHVRAASMVPADILLDELHSVLGTDLNASTRNFIATVLIGNDNDGLTSKLSASKVPSKLFELAKSSNLENSEWAVSLLQQLIPRRITTTIQGLEPWLIQAIEGSKEASRTFNLCVLLLQLDRRSPTVISGLLKILDDPMSKYAVVHEQAADMIHAIAPFSDETLKRLCRHLNRFDATYPPSESTQKVMFRVIQTLRDFGNQATAASSSIRSFLSKKGHRGQVQSLQSEAANLLSYLEKQSGKQIGPGVFFADQGTIISSAVHKHANEDEQNNCRICQIAREAVKIAERQLDSARHRVESGTADASSAHDAMAHLLKTKLRLARLTGEPLEQIIEIAEEHVKALEGNVGSAAALFETGAATRESILDAQSELMNAQLELELLKSGQSKTELPSEAVSE